jgi:hypothetical protein
VELKAELPEVPSLQALRVVRIIKITNVNTRGEVFRGITRFYIRLSKTGLTYTSKARFIIENGYKP